MKAKNLIRVTWLREALGNAPLMQTARRLAKALAAAEIPHLIVGGLAVQEHGYVRTTLDVDIVVPDVDEARDYLSIHGFQEVRGTKMKMIDRANRVDVDLLPGGGCVGPCQGPGRRGRIDQTRTATNTASGTARPH